MKKLNTNLLLAMLLAALLSFSAQAEATSRKPTTELTKQALDATRDQWIAFRNYNGEQWIYFTQLISWKCGLNQIRYSINNESLENNFPLPECNPQMPFAVDPENNEIYLRFPLGRAKTVSVQLVYGDDTVSPMMTYKPCNVEGDSTCATPVKRGEEN